jgi:D-sedoheptulose 7-phosphate isomerase
VAFIQQYLAEMQQIAAALDVEAIDRLVELLVAVRQRDGRVFCLGIGGSAGNASHAVCDFRKLGGLEAYSALDNLSELTAQINDNGWEDCLANWLRESRLTARDLVFVLSVGGGSLEHNISPNLVRAIQYARGVGAAVAGIVGRDGGYTAQAADVCVVIPTVNSATVTPHTESFQAAVWHLLVSDPRLQTGPARWESVTPL